MGTSIDENALYAMLLKLILFINEVIIWIQIAKTCLLFVYLLHIDMTFDFVINCKLPSVKSIIYIYVIYQYS